MSNAGPGLSVRVVLVRPRNPLNIGAAARAMANFGLDDLVVVKPYEPVWRETVSAVGAERLVLAARKAYSLEEAVRECHWVVGTTAVGGRRLERPLARLPELPALIRRRRKRSPFRLALVFGPEKTGLSNKYLERCQQVLTIPTAPQCPSMNLGQAVAVCCYELFRDEKSFGPQGESPDPWPATAGQIHQLVRKFDEVFQAAGYLDFLPPAERARKIRRALLQWNIHRLDVAVLHGVGRSLLKKLRRPEA